MPKNNTNGWVRSSLIIAGAVIIAKVLGFVRDQIIAISFGLNSHTDAYYIAFNLLGGIFVTLGGAGGAFYIMTQKLLSTAIAENDMAKATKQLANTLLFYSITALLITLPCYLYADIIAKAIAPSASPLLLELIRMNLLWLIPLIILTPIVGIISGFLASRGDDFLIGINSVYPSIAIIVGMLFFTKALGSIVLAISTTIGSLFQIIALLPALMKKVRTKAVQTTHFSANIKLSLEILVPIALSSLMGLVNFTVDMAFASGLDAGSASALSLSYKIMTVPVGIILTALLLPIFPMFTQLVLYKDWERLRYQYHLAIDIYGFLIMLLAAVIVVLSLPMIALLFNYGNFSSSNLHLLALTLAILAPTMLFYGHRDILVRLAYSLNLIRFVMMLSIFSIFLNWLFDYILIQYIGLSGIIISTLLVNMIYIATLYFVIHSINSNILNAQMLVSHIKLITIFAVVGFCGYEIYSYYHTEYGSITSNLITLAIFGTAVAGTFLLLTELLVVRSGMIMNIMRRITRK